MSLAHRLACHAALLRLLANGEARIQREYLRSLAADLQDDADALDAAAARRAEHEYQHGRRAA